jgi:hypothetical protein
VVVEFVGEEGRGSSSYCKKYQLLFLTIQCFEGIFQAGSTSTYNLTSIPNQRSKHARAPRMSTQPIRYIMMCQLAQVRANAHRLSRSQFRQRDSKSGESHIQRSLLTQNSGWDVAVAEVEDVGRENQPAASLFSSSSKRVNLGVGRSQSIPRRVQRRAGEGVGLLICSWDFVGQAWDFVREEDWFPAVDDWPAFFIPLDAADESLAAERGGAVYVAAGEEDDVSPVVGRFDEGPVAGGLDCEVAVIGVAVVEDRVVWCWVPGPLWGF